RHWRHLAKQSSVNEWQAHFQRVCHTSPIRIAQELIAHIKRRFKRRHPREGFIWRRLQGSSDVAKRLQDPQTLNCLFLAHQLPQAPRKIEPPPQEIGAGVTTSIHHESRDFGIELYKMSIDTLDEAAESSLHQRNSRDRANKT